MAIGSERTIEVDSKGTLHIGAGNGQVKLDCGNGQVIVNSGSGQVIVRPGNGQVIVDGAVISPLKRPEGCGQTGPLSAAPQ